MPDMLVRLYALPPLSPALEALRARGVEVRRARGEEQAQIVGWVGRRFGPRWGNECAASFHHRPVTCHLAVELTGPFPPPGAGYALPAERLIGFACHHVVARGMFGPTGVAEPARGQGVGTALLLAALHAMASDGYAYAAIARVGPVEFYQRAVGATLIEGSEPGVYRGKLDTDGDP
jgi:GNAT superfamily N-acetyltransferase